MRKLDASKRKMIIEAATNRFLHFGLKKTSMIEIAQDVNLAVGTLYIYFPNKNDLLVACVNSCEKSHEDFVQKIITSKLSVESRIKKYIHHRFFQDQKNRQSKNISANLQNHILEIFPEKRREEEKIMVDTIRTLLSEGDKSGELSFVINLKTDLTIFVHSLNNFFPLAKSIKVKGEPSEKDLLETLNWFFKIWNKKN